MKKSFMIMTLFGLSLRYNTYDIDGDDVSMISVNALIAF